MSDRLAPWADVVRPGTRVLVVVNSAAQAIDEVARVVGALARTAGLAQVSAIAPLELRPWLAARGVSGRAILVPRVAGLDVEFDSFLERGETVRWALSRAAALVMGSQPYAPGNEEVKAAFERRIAPMLGDGRYVAHTLPGQAVVVLSAPALWERAARDAALARHRRRVEAAVGRLHAWYEAAGTPEAGDVAALLAGDEPAREPAAVRQAREYAVARLSEAAAFGAASSTPRVFVDPPGGQPGAGWLPDRVQPVRRPAQAAAGLRWRGTRLVVRGEAGSPYGYLLMSRPAMLAPGDAAMAEGRVYAGGVTIGLVKDEQWASRVDVDEPGAFLAAAVAREQGRHALVVALCLRGPARRVGVAIRRFGWVCGRR